MVSSTDHTGVNPKKHWGVGICTGSNSRPGGLCGMGVLDFRRFFILDYELWLARDTILMDGEALGVVTI